MDLKSSFHWFLGWSIGFTGLFPHQEILSNIFQAYWASSSMSTVSCLCHVLKSGVLDLEFNINSKQGYALPLEVFTCKTVVKLKLVSGFGIDFLLENALLPALKTFLRSVRFYSLLWLFVPKASFFLPCSCGPGHIWCVLGTMAMVSRSCLLKYLAKNWQGIVANPHGFANDSQSLC